MIVQPLAVSILLLGAGAAIVTPRHAAAGVLDATALTTGAPSASAGLFTLTAGPSGGVLDRKTTLGVSGIGVSGPGSMVAGEIDSGEFDHAPRGLAAAPERLLARLPVRRRRAR